MSQFRCTICGFIFEETKGLAEQGIVAGTSWEKVPEDFACPLCGAAKPLFEPIDNQPATTTVRVQNDVHPADHADLSIGQLAAICSNLAKGCEKQQLAEEKVLFEQLADFFASGMAGTNDAELDGLRSDLQSDLSTGYPEAFAIASAQSDRGALRALTWSEKVSKMTSYLLNRHQKEGSTILDNAGIYVCEICGFIYLGDKLPDICPVCKVPNFKMTAIAR